MQGDSAVTPHRIAIAATVDFTTAPYNKHCLARVSHHLEQREADIGKHVARAARNGRCAGIVGTDCCVKRRGDWDGDGHSRLSLSCGRSGAKTTDVCLSPFSDKRRILQKDRIDKSAVHAGALI